MQIEAANWGAEALFLFWRSILHERLKSTWEHPYFLFKGVFWKLIVARDLFIFLWSFVMKQFRDFWYEFYLIKKPPSFGGCYSWNDFFLISLFIGLQHDVFFLTFFLYSYSLLFFLFMGFEKKYHLCYNLIAQIK